MSVDGLGFDGTTLWVCTERPGGGLGVVSRLWALDPTTGGPTRSPLKVLDCSGYRSLVFAHGYVWTAAWKTVGRGQGGRGVTAADGISRIDLQTGQTTTFPVTRGWGLPEAFWDGSVWVTGHSGLLRVDPITGRVQAVVSEQPFEGPGFLTIEQGDVWFTDGSSVYRVDAATDQVIATIPLPQCVDGMAGGEGAVWVACHDGTLYRIDPATNKISGEAYIEEGLSHVAVAYGRVWTISTQTIVSPQGILQKSVDHLTQVDPRSLRILGQRVSILPGAHSSGFLAAGGSLWVGDTGPGCAETGLGLVRIDLQPGGGQSGSKGRNPPWLRPGYVHKSVGC